MVAGLLSLSLNSHLHHLQNTVKAKKVGLASWTSQALAVKRWVVFI